LKAFVEDLINGAATAAEAWLAWTADLVQLAVAGAWQAGWDSVDAALFAAELPLYGLLASYRWLPARMGFAYPLREELERRFLTVADPRRLHFPQRHASALTALHWLRQDAFALDDILRCARYDSGREDPPSFAGPYRPGDDPLVLIDGSPGRPPSANPWAWFSADSPDETDLADQTLAVTGALGLGSAVDLCRSLAPAGIPMPDAMASLPDLNLDADRGYGYRCWYHWSDRTGRPATNPLLDPVVKVGYGPDF
jgi:hypothetical protein